MNREFFTFSEPYYFGKPLSADSDRVAYWSAGQIVAHAISDGPVLLQTDLGGSLVENDDSSEADIVPMPGSGAKGLSCQMKPS